MSPSTRSPPRSTIPALPAVVDADFPEMSVKVSVLSARRNRVAGRLVRRVARGVRPGVDGLTVESGSHQATLLPSVWPKVVDADEFLDALWAQGRAAARRVAPVDQGRPATARSRSATPDHGRRSAANVSARDDAAVHARSRAHATRPHREAARVDGRRGRRRPAVVRAGQRVVRDRRARARPPITCGHRGGAPSRCSSAMPSGRISTPSSRVRRSRCRRRSSTRRSKSRPRDGRDRARRRSFPTACSRSTTRRSRCGSSCATARPSTRAWCSRRPSS